MKDTEPITPLDFIKNIRLATTVEQVDEIETYARKEPQITCEHYEIIKRIAKNQRENIETMSIEEYADRIKLADTPQKVTELCGNVYLDEDISVEEITRLRPMFIRKLEEVSLWQKEEA